LVQKISHNVTDFAFQHSFPTITLQDTGLEGVFHLHESVRIGLDWIGEKSTHAHCADPNRSRVIRNDAKKS